MSILLPSEFMVNVLTAPLLCVFTVVVLLVPSGYSILVDVVVLVDSEKVVVVVVEPSAFATFSSLGSVAASGAGSGVPVGSTFFSPTETLNGAGEASFFAARCRPVVALCFDVV